MSEPTPTASPAAALYLRACRRVGRSYGTWRVASLLLNPHVSIPGPDGLPFTLDMRDPVCFGILMRGFAEQSERSLVASLLPPTAVSLDIGASVGVWSRFLSHVCPEGRVYAFEPSASTFKLLATNTRAVRNVEPLMAGCGRESGRAALSKERSSGLRHLASEGEPVTLTTVDAFCANLDRLEFMKIDVEGTELDVLEGATRTVERLRPLVMFEAAPGTTHRYGHALEDLLRFFTERGYRVRRISTTCNYLASP